MTGASVGWRELVRSSSWPLISEPTMLVVLKNKINIFVDSHRSHLLLTKVLMPSRRIAVVLGGSSLDVVKRLNSRSHKN